ncbi:MAG: bifunctional phosphopantothenoylcysteine decarboxylase/phosphopantothenate--cysteine ligase CoaBC [Pseudomonadales bacterium]|nr:bifunctional phosphopantothenoylcysteine decarboxylase/phosphopantothenate--cysteine ligase CoaBC [Pseudomonadales bacterium]
MKPLLNRQIILGVTGGIAAYKSAELLRKLQTAGADVRVVMTKGATEFITPLTLQALSGKPVHLALLDADAEAAMGHIELARWADAIIIAPASADFIARLANGEAGNLLQTLCLASPSPIAIAPAMNQQMWASPATQTNLETLIARGIRVFGPANGIQACGDTGPGRMLEPEEIADLSCKLFETGHLQGKKVVITAGPTREALDPVRYISNQSSGKMGYALAQASIDAGAETWLITGPTNITHPAKARVVNVVSALDMHRESLNLADKADVFIATAAVADYRPAIFSDQKIKKTTDDTLQITLVKNPDIVRDVASLETKPYTVGFAAETENLIEYAKTKLLQKNLDMIIANDVSGTETGFNSENNAVTVIWKDGNESFPVTSKKKLAIAIINLVSKQLR